MARSVYIVIGSLAVGGTERQLFELLPRINQHGIPVSVHTLIEMGELGMQLREKGVEVYAPPAHRLLKRMGRFGNRALVAMSMVRLLYIVLFRAPIAVHCYLPAAYVVGGLCCVLAGFDNLILSRRSLNDYQAGHPVLAKVERYLHGKLAVAIGNSKKILDDLEREGVPRDKICLIYNGVCLERFESAAPASRERIGANGGEVVIICVANLIPYKGHEELIKALALVERDARNGYRLVCIGRDDGILASLRKLAEDLRVSHRISWLGERQDVVEYLLASDIGVLVSHQEGFSNAILEYMAAGLPIVATNVGGTAEQVVDGVTGILVPPRNVNAIAAALTELIDDAARRNSYAKAGRRRVMEEFPLERPLASLEAIYFCSFLKSNGEFMRKLTEAARSLDVNPPDIGSTRMFESLPAGVREVIEVCTAVKATTAVSLREALATVDAEDRKVVEQYFHVDRTDGAGCGYETHA